MAGATASTTAGATIASQTFSQTLLAHGVPAMDAGAMIHSGATVIDSLPHGSFFHATGGSVNMAIKDRMKIAEIPKAAEAYAPAAFIYTELFIPSILLRQIIY